MSFQYVLKELSVVYGSRLALRLAGTTVCEAMSAPPEQLFDVGELQFHIGRTAVIALAGIGRVFHLAKQRVHLFRLEAASGAYRAMAGHGGGDMHQPAFQRQGLVPFRHMLGEVAQQTAGIGFAEQ